MNYTPEEIAELLKDKPQQPHYIAGLVRKAVEAEREACAAICDRFAARDMHPAECAGAIRMRSNAAVKPRSEAESA